MHSLRLGAERPACAAMEAAALSWSGCEGRSLNMTVDVKPSMTGLALTGLVPSVRMARVAVRSCISGRVRERVLSRRGVALSRNNNIHT